MNVRVSCKTLFDVLQLAGLLLVAACATAPQDPQASRPVGNLIFPDPPEEPRFIYERSLYSDANVTAEQEGAKLREMLTGVNPQSGLGAMVKPYGIAVFQGRVFVSDPAARHVRVFDVPNQKAYIIGDDAGLGQLTKPMGLSVDRLGNLYVADATANAVVVFDKDGRFLRRIGGPKWLSRVVGVTVDPRGDRMYVTDVGGVRSQDHRVRVFNPVDGTHMFDIGGRGPGAGQLNFPYDVAVGKEGRLYVVDSGNFRVQIFDRDGKYLSSFGAAGKQYGSFARPKQIAADAEGNVYVVDAAFANFQIFNSAGQLLMFIGRPSETDGPARYVLPAGITVDEDGRVYVVDQWHKKVDIFRPARLTSGQGYLAIRTKAGTVKK